MGRATRRDHRDTLGEDAAEAEARAFVDTWVRRNANVTAKDRLHLFAGDGEEGELAPADVRRDPERLLKWTEVFQPDMIVSDATAAVNARNRTGSELWDRVRQARPGERLSVRLAADFLRQQERGSHGA